MAAPDLTIRVEGLANLNYRLMLLADELGPQRAINTLRTPMRNSLNKIANNIRNTTPVDEGTLAESTKVRVTRITRSLARSKYVDRDAIIYGRVGWFWNRAQPSQWAKALSVEFGTRYIPPKRVLRNQINALSAEVRTTFAREVSRSIQRAVRKIARNRTRSG